MSSKLYLGQSFEEASQRIKSNKNILQKLNKFYELTTNTNKNKCLAIEFGNHFNKQNNFDIELAKKNKDISISTNQYNQKKLYELERNIPIKQGFGLFGIVLRSFLYGFLIIFLVDFYFDLQNQIDIKTKQIAKCHQDYHQNNCFDPLQALVQQCNRLEFCSSRDPKSLLKISSVFVKTIASLVGIFANHLQITGVIFLVILVVIYLNRPTMYQKQKVCKYQ